MEKPEKGLSTVKADPLCPPNILTLSAKQLSPLDVTVFVARTTFSRRYPCMKVIFGGFLVGSR